MKILTPRRIVAELDKYIVGQAEAKRAVAIALRNRWRRQQLPPELHDEVAPKNIIMIGPTGVGKTEIARRLAGLVDAPFIKVEASKYTEVGYHGRDVESMVRDLTSIAVSLVGAEQREAVRETAAAAAEEQLLNALLPIRYDDDDNPVQIRPDTREKIRSKLRSGELDEREVEPDVGARGDDARIQGDQALHLVVVQAGHALRALQVRAGASVGRSSGRRTTRLRSV